MPEAVIVAAARSPIGRAYKGSLTRRARRRPRRADRAGRPGPGARARPARDRRPDARLRASRPASRATTSAARSPCTSASTCVPGTTVNRYCASSLQTTRMAFHAIKAGEGDAFVSAGVECVSRYASGQGRRHARTPATRSSPTPRRAPRRAPRPATPGTTRASDGELPDVYIAMGQTAENVAAARAASAAASRTSSRVRSQNLAEKALADGFWDREITPVTLPDGTVAAHATTARAPASRWRRSPRSSRSSAPTAPSPPATAARSTTAPPRWSS